MTTIDSLLIANRGEVAERIIRTCRRLGIRAVAVHSDPDAGARYVRLADAAVPIGGTTPQESYLRIDAILDAAQMTGVDAIHPGYGFLAENAEFARRCDEAGVTFIGPSPEAIVAMGDKITAKETVAAAGVPILPSATIGAGTTDPAAASADAAALGLPLLVKASAGGGGKGMHVVRDPSQLDGAIDQARREAASAFGDDTVFVERYVEGGRHIEVQVFGDLHGNVVSLFERECSLQRRHQKVLEEAPSTAVDPELRSRLGAAALAAARAVDYVGAGTIEFLLAPGGDFFFLEMNTRLQVEHPVTEQVTGLDLVELQIAVAAGAPLPPRALAPVLDGHAIEVRLYAEDPAAEFAPATGRLVTFEIPADGIRIESGVESGSVVSPFYDPMLAKVIAHGASREEAARRLAARLAEARINGVRTNRDLLVRLLRDPAFQAGAIDTTFLERPEAHHLRAPLVDAEVEPLYAIAAALSIHAANAATGPLSALPAGWRNNRSRWDSLELEGPSGICRIEYEPGREHILVRGPGGLAPRVLTCRADHVELIVDGVLTVFAVQRAADRVWVNSRVGACEFSVLPRFPESAEVLAGSLEAPMPGRVIRITAGIGDEVAAGDVLAVIEAMKMELEITAPGAGRITELPIAVGDQIDAGVVVAVIDSSSDDDGRESEVP